jgi:hypothetical protein
VARDSEDNQFISDEEELDEEFELLEPESYETIDLTFEAEEEEEEEKEKEESNSARSTIPATRRRTLRPQLPPPLAQLRNSRRRARNSQRNEETLSEGATSSRRRTPITRQDSGVPRRSSTRLASNRNRSSRSRTVSQKRND